MTAVLTAERSRHLPVAAPRIHPRDLRWLARTTRAAARSDHPWQIAALVVRGASVVACATNRFRNDPLIVADKLWCASEHAEMAALRAVKDPAGTTMYVARVGADGTGRYARPCARCDAALAAAGVTRVVWTCDTNYMTLPAGHGAA